MGSGFFYVFKLLFFRPPLIFLKNSYFFVKKVALPLS